jgi:hypothetical protein
LKRKGKKYRGLNWQLYQTAYRRRVARTLDAPGNFSIIHNHDAVVAYFDGVRYAQENREFIRVNLAEIDYIDLATISVLMAHMYDERLPSGYLTVVGPKKEQPRGVFKRVQFDETVTSGNSSSAHFLSRKGVEDNQEHKLSILARVAKFSDGKKDKDLNPILTEILSNTNNHASVKEKGIVPWLVTLEESEDEKTIKFCVTDLGVGIYDRLRFTHRSMKKFPFPDWIRTFFQESQNTTLSRNIPKGLLSSTKLFYRGQGMRNIHNIVMNGSFKSFNIITNKAHVNMLNLDHTQSDALQNFRGTLYYWTIDYDK